ncbi:MAG: PLxRFG domain-containing protein, partial [Paucibacter sp.]|nr:PLxRFG domain-containing protein [Roseateles sp.]
PAAEPVATSGATARPRTTASAAPVPSERQAPAAPGAKIDDFGEKLVGARKDYAATLGDAMAVDVAAEPLSKSWPEPDYEKLLAGGTDPFAVAWVHAARDEIPVKPVKSWRLTGWVDNVKLLRDIAQQLLDGRLSAEAVRTKMKDPAYRNVAAAVGGRVELYEAVGHGKSLKGVSFAEHHYSLYRGESNVHKWVVEQKARATAFSNWPRTIAEGNTKVEALALFKDRIASLDLGEKAKKQPQFVIYRKRGVPGAFIGKKIGREHIDLKKLDDVDAARKYLETGAAQLEAALAKYKETPLERNAANQPRVGDDHRNGAPVTPEVFAETFGFRGVQFGNYVEQGRRQSDLNQTFDALMDLAAVLGIPARSLSLNGRLGLAFGARGKGGVNAPAAHFEPGNVVINLTKGGGPGSLAHEWWHALDNYFARQGGDGGGFVTGGAKTDLLREQMKRAFDVVRRATQIGALRKRSAELDKRRSKPYWDTPIELSARSFESYVIAKLQDQSAANDYLANVVSPDSWGAIESLRAGALGEPVAPSYPYPLADEMPGLRAGFDEFFQAVEARASDDGNVALLSRGEGGGVDASELRKTLEPLTKSWAAGPAGGVHVVQSVDDLPARLSEGIKSVGAEETVRAMFVPSSSTVYLVADNLTSIEEAQTALFHEVYGHLGLRAFLGDQYADVMGRMRDANRKLAGEAVMWFLANGQDEIDVRVQRGMTKEAARRQVQLLAVEEALADRAGRNEPISSWRFLAAQLQKALRAIGLDKVADWMEDKTQAEVMDLLRQARDAVKRRPPGMAQAARGAGELAMSRDDTPALSRKPSEAIADLTPQLVKDMLAGRGFKRVSWWHKSVGTMFDMAQKHPAFKKVFDGAQAYIQDTSFFANDAADQAPQVLPQLNGFGDFKKALSLPDADRKAIAVPIFEGTLNWTRDAKGALVETDDVASAGVVFTPEELASRFKLNDHQIGLYREFRAAVDRSLESTMAGDLIRYLGDHAPAGSRDLARAGEFKALRAAVLAKVDTLPAGKLQDEIRAEVNDKLERLDSLKARGYAPLMRFGKFAVRVIGAGGESKFFGLYESGADAAKAARLLSEDPQFKNDEITRGVMSQEDFKLLKGLSPETLGLFASITGTDKNEAMQLWLKQATSNRSALKRMIKRKGVEGYSEDVSRVLSGFITSNARGASQGLHFGEMQQNVSDIREGDIKDAAERLRNYVQNPVEEAAGLRGFLFVNFLGGSIASAAVNMTQPFLMTMPYLSKFVGIPGAARVMGASLKQMTAGVDGDMKTALEIAEKDGIVSPQELHQLQAMAMGRGSLLGQAARFAGANDQISATLDAAGKRAMFIWGAPFALAEQFNRRLTFIAAYQVAKEKHHIDPYAFAAQAVTETQGLYNKANRPEWARGAIGATLFTFKQYSISYLEFMKRMWTAGEPGSIERAEGRKAALFGLALLVMAAGAQGLPGADDLDDLIDTIGQKMGEDTNSKAWKQKNLPAWLQYGFSALPGIPLDVAGRLGIGNLLPGTGLLRKDKADKSGDVLEVFGAVGGVAKNAMLAADSGSLIPMLPTAIANAMKAVDIAKTGAYRDTKGRRVIDADLGDAAIKGIGFQPATVAAASRADGLTIAHNTLARNTEASIASEWAAARFEGDAEGEKGARARLKQWNDTNPDTPIAISMPQIIKRVQQMRSTRAERIVKSTPKELRQPAKAG